jgi:hypothetical protein
MILSVALRTAGASMHASGASPRALPAIAGEPFTVRGTKAGGRDEYPFKSAVRCPGAYGFVRGDRPLATLVDQSSGPEAIADIGTRVVEVSSWPSADVIDTW